MTSNHFILADGRWFGPHGIGRFAREIISRLHQTDILSQGPSPLSFKNFYWLPYQLAKHKKQYRMFFSPGFMPPLYSAVPFVFTIHDLIHIHGPNGNGKLVKKLFYATMIQTAIRRAYKIITVSEYSKQQIIAWANVAADKIIVAKNGISAAFSPHGEKHTPGYPYFLYVGNTKPHKNIPRLLQAFASARIDISIRLILTGQLTAELKPLIQQHRLQERVIFSGELTEAQLANYYRGAIALLFPSLYEGFGLPVVEAMAAGVPVITSNVTSLPEIAGGAAIMINPYEVGALAFNIEQMAMNTALQKTLIEKGLKRAAEFSWDASAQIVQQALSTP